MREATGEEAREEVTDDRLVLGEDITKGAEFSHLPRNRAADNNKQAILDALHSLGLSNRRVFEIGSGTGQHGIHFCQHLPTLRWLPSEVKDNLTLLQAWLGVARDEGVFGINQAVEFDLNLPQWPNFSFDTLYSANVLHIINREQAQRMIEVGAYKLARGELFVAYGPFKRDGQFTTDSNRDFDHYLRTQVHGGLIDMETIQVWSENRLKLRQALDMPANNFLLVFEKA